ncbi:hypothetical protein CRG98_011410 [Punica granatum]|uniref:Uncharacterized protein n=1 Tax=Punica granatum TaxID=22663 RepID=A0A2I0KIA9_PUNGR|nr:hypothetical protein CRG98_011410 [Punica granatum]
MASGNLTVGKISNAASGMILHYLSLNYPLSSPPAGVVEFGGATAGGEDDGDVKP